MLNLALTDTPFGGYQVGRIVNLIGDSHSGKSIFALTMFAEMVNMKEFDNYALYYDDAENALSFNINDLFGEETSKRINKIDYCSTTIQSFYGGMQEIIDKKIPFVYILDSLDALTDEAEIEKDKKFRKTPEERNKKEKAGEYGMAIPKFTGKTLKNIISAIATTNSLLIVISQTRDNVDFGFEKKRRSGGRALKFFSSAEIWLSVMGVDKQVVGGNERVIGVNGKCKIKKNKMTGKIRECEFAIFYDYGIDDIGCNVDFLVKNKVWKTEGKGILSPYFTEKVSRKKLLNKIEELGWEETRKLQQLVGETWCKIEEAHKLGRKRLFK